jgi:GNAT superfamily N-acetyltransferase
MKASPPTDARLTVFFRALLAAELRKDRHLVEMSDDGGGAAIWLDVGDPGMSNGDLVRSFPKMVSVFRTGFGRTMRLMTAMEATHPVEPHRYLYFVGVRRDRQGTGLGAALLASVLDRCDADGTPAYLENSNPANAAFYARHGFVERDPVALPGGAPPMIPMWRNPRTP